MATRSRTKNDQRQLRSSAGVTVKAKAVPDANASQTRRCVACSEAEGRDVKLHGRNKCPLKTLAGADGKPKVSAGLKRNERVSQQEDALVSQLAAKIDELRQARAAAASKSTTAAAASSEELAPTGTAGDAEDGIAGAHDGADDDDVEDIGDVDDIDRPLVDDPMGHNLAELLAEAVANGGDLTGFASSAGPDGFEQMLAIGEQPASGVPPTVMASPPPSTVTPQEVAVQAADDQVVPAQRVALATLDANSMEDGPSDKKRCKTADTANRESATSGSTKRQTSEIPNGWKGNTAGGGPMRLLRNGTEAYRVEKVLKFASGKEKNKSARHDVTPMFQGVVGKLEALTDTFPGWAIAVYLPQDGNGHMRSWHSESVEQDEPELPGIIREQMFSHLAEHRAQRAAEDALIKERLTREKRAAEDKARGLQAELDEARAALKLLKRKRASSDASAGGSGSGSS